LTLSDSNKQTRWNVKEPGQLARMRLADGALPIQHVGDDAARSEHRNQIALPNTAISMVSFR
jgi:hypothetical protein